MKYEVMLILGDLAGQMPWLDLITHFNCSSDPRSSFFCSLMIFFIILRNKKISVWRRPILLTGFGLAILTVLGFVTLAAWLLLPSLSSRQRLVGGALHSLPADIKEIDIQPHPGIGYHSLVSAPMVIDDRAEIGELTEAPSHAAGMSPNHPQGQWWAWITVKTAKGDFDFTVEQSNSTDNGTVINFMSAIDNGWEIGDFRCDPLGTVLEKIKHNHAP